ncbi:MULTISPECIES: hypothetical protein [unclassified Streptomyces]|uniref:TlpA family protein disulfide reductase n=1 Tax=unclassified Streptomyces TaxID=2593676 RepID=UPI0033EB767F
MLVGALCLFDLLLTLAVLRRLREHTAELERLGTRSQFAAYDPAELLGRRIPEIADENEARWVAFFEANCSSCHEHAPQFAAEVREHSALAVISGNGEKADRLADHMVGAATVVRDAQADELVNTAGIQAFPTFLVLDRDGSVIRSTTELSELSDLVPTA